MQVFFPLTEDTFVQLISSCLLPDGTRTSAHVYILSHSDNIDFSATTRARLHGRDPTCQMCGRKLTLADDDNSVQCGRADCDNPDAVYLIPETVCGKPSCRRCCWRERCGIASDTFGLRPDLRR